MQILTRWSRGTRVTRAETNMIAALYNDMISLSTDTPAVILKDINTEQDKFEPPVFSSKGDDEVYRKTGKMDPK